ncbi:MAG: adenosine kinase [Alphaproteobacteria bacterium]|jgi:sugar/nucleoside kinase (ribokinase family)|nr:adenosine kinase [Alphaproteobacteria bacterium]MDP6830552.1 adenosine kinase [Alphaproteobacteria bacterium]MDP6875706.1 adenosine kinase [Alphaproteobacteria bacterium]
MAEIRYDVLGIGNAIVDVLAPAEDSFLAQHNLAKGAMMLIDGYRAQELYAAMGVGTESSGGSAANTVAGVAALGGRACFIGKVFDDELGRIFAHDIRAVGVDFHSQPATGGAPTARCLIMVTPDAMRTMNTFLGACIELGPEDVDEDLVAASAITYLEGYLWDPPGAKEAFLKAMGAARAADRKVALSLSDSFCVDRHREEFQDLVEHHVDILFANEQEIISLYEVDTFDAAMQAVRGYCEIAALTRSEKGAVIVAGEEVHVIDAEPVDHVVDTTGAGDIYAAGFLTGLAAGRDLPDCGRMAGIGAAEVISHMGARPEADLQELMRAKLG